MSKRMQMKWRWKTSQTKICRTEVMKNKRKGLTRTWRKPRRTMSHKMGHKKTKKQIKLTEKLNTHLKK